MGLAARAEGWTIHRRIRSGLVSSLQLTDLAIELLNTSTKNSRVGGE